MGNSALTGDRFETQAGLRYYCSKWVVASGVRRKCRRPATTIFRCGSVGGRWRCSLHNREQGTTTRLSMYKSNHDRIEQLAAELFNASVPVGSEIIYVDDNGERQTVVTRSAAWLLPSGKAVVQLKGRPACFSLSRCRVPAELIRRANANG